MTIAALARFLRISVDAVIDAARELSIVDPERFIKALKSPPGNFRAHVRRTANQSLERTQLRVLLDYYRFDSVPKDVLLSACETKISQGDCDTAEVEEVLTALEVESPGFNSADRRPARDPMEPDLVLGSGNPLPGVPFGSPYYESDLPPVATLWKVGAGITLLSLCIGVVAAPGVFPDAYAQELTTLAREPSVGGVLSLVALGLFANLFFVGFGVVYLARAFRRFPWVGVTSGQLLGKVTQTGLSEESDYTSAHVYPMVLLRYEVDSTTYLGLYGDHYNLKLDHVTFAIGPFAKASPGSVFDLYFDPEDPGDFSLSKQPLVKVTRVVLGCGSLAFGVLANFAIGFVINRALF